MLISRLLGATHRCVAANRIGIWITLKARNQAASILGQRLGDGPDMELNGELWLLQKLAPRASVFVDIGANGGVWTAAFLGINPDAKGFLFEPAPSALDSLRKNLQVAVRAQKVEIIAAAASDQIGAQTFFSEPSAGETSSFFEQHSAPCARPVTVATTTLDAEMSKRGITYVDVLKIDAEGSDLRVLKGAVGYLGKQRIRVIQFEYNAPWRYAGNTLADALHLLRSCGYSVYLLKRAGLYEFDYGVYGDFFAYSNFVALLPDSGLAPLPSRRI